MKKILFTFLFALIVTPAFAAFEDTTNAGQAAGNINTVKNVLDAEQDDIYMCLEGNIVSKVRKEDYSFKDATGTVIVDIDDYLLYNITVTPANLVRICGEVDKEWSKNNEFDVKQIQIIK